MNEPTQGQGPMDRIRQEEEALKQAEAARTGERERIAREAIAEAGAIWGGIQVGVGDLPTQALFKDPHTGTTLAVDLENITVEKIRTELARSAKDFAKEEN